jgi:hypothetical protein
MREKMRVVSQMCDRVLAKGMETDRLHINEEKLRF